ncbi:MAG: hypothetical protein CL693_17740 [Cellvibrionaceae bacterium]|nr:hypothetical protein [Cellvibrionaceae bacterium]|tara:strand:+ start:3489 stop:3929 length:441 start_codon:yes stop_codon:yes gene_type:complete
MRVLGALLLVSGSLQAEEFPGVEKLMEPSTYKAAGLEKLTDKERQALNQWLIIYTANEAPIIRGSVEAVKKEQNKEVKSRISGTFSGWQGNSVFVLDNGQHWQQRNDAVWKTNKDSPEVLIRKNLFGFYEMKLVGTNRVVGVKRIR